MSTAANELRIELPLPPSANHLTANAAKGGRVKTKEYKDWIDNARYHAITQWRAAGKPQWPAKTPMHLDIRVGLTGRQRDLSNTVKAIEDCLVRELPVPDDRWNDYLTVCRDESVAGRAVITIAPLTPT